MAVLRDSIIIGEGYESAHMVGSRVREHRILITHRYSARWAGRFNRVTSGNAEATFAWPDALILCDLCNKSFPEPSDTEILLLQYRWDLTEPWKDMGTRCPDCQEGLENIPKVKEDEEEIKEYGI